MAQSPVELSLSTPLSSTISPTNSTIDMRIDYKFLLPATITYPELLILVMPSSKLIDPIIVLSQNNSDPSVSENLTDCHSYDVGVCTVFLRNLILDSWLYINVSCNEECSYTIRLDPSYHNESISLNEAKILHFVETSNHILTFYLDNLDENAYILIAANPMNPEDLIDTFHLYVKQGDFSPSSIDFDYYPHHIWHQGKGVSISKSSPSINLLTQINYTILIEALPGAVIMLTANEYNKTRDVELGKAVRDIIEFKEIHYFSLSLNDEDITDLQNSSIIFKLKTYSGDPDIYIHYDTKPKNLDDWEWSSVEEESDGINVTPAELDVLGATRQLFYVAIKGNRGGAYEFEAISSKKDFNVIDFYETLTGHIMHKEQVNYRLGIKKSDKNVNIIEAKALSGNVKIFVKLCCEKSDCVINEKNESFMKYDNHDVVKKLKFRYNGTECLSNMGSMCFYAIMVEGANEQISKYSITVQRGKQSTVLEESQIFRGSLNMREHDYFRYLLLNNTDSIETLHLQVNFISGEGRVYFSKEIEYPNATNCDIQTDNRDFIDLTIKKEDMSTGNYYLTIEAKTLVDFTILVLIERKEEELDYMSLLDGHPVKFQFDSIDQHFYFQATNAPHCKKIFFNLQPIWGFFTGYVLEIDKNYLPNAPAKNFYDYMISEDEGLTIEVQDTVLFYRIMIEIDENYKNGNDMNTFMGFMAYRFSFMYTSCQSVEDLSFGVVKHIRTIENQRKFLRIRYSSKEDFLTIIALSEETNKEFHFWGSLSSNNQFPSFSIHDFQLNATNFNLTFQKENLIPYCSELNTNDTLDSKSSHHCSMYLSVESPREELTFSVLILRDFSPIRLKDGSVLSMAPLNANETIQLFFEVTNKAPISIFFTSQSSTFYVYASVNKDLVYPTAYNNSFVSTGNQQLFTELIIPKSFLNSQNCFITSVKPCFLLLTLEAQKKSSNAIRISVSSSLIPLKEGHPIMTSVEAGMIKYFSLKIIDNEAESFIVSVSPIGEGDPDLYISKGINSMPTLTNSDWKKTSMKEDHLKITKEDVNGTLKGTYLLGIYGFSKCSFVLNALISQNVQGLAVGLMMDFEVADVQLLEYYHFGSEGFKILVMDVTGNATLYMNTYVDKTKEYIGSFPNKDNFMWKNEQNSIIINQNDLNFCENCHYLLAIKAWENPSKISLLVKENNVYSEMRNGIDVDDFIETNDQNLYSFRTFTGYMELSMILLSGDVEVFIGSNPFYEKNSPDVFSKSTRKNFTGNRLNLKLGNSFTILDYSTNSTEEDRAKNFYVLIFGVLNSSFSLRFTTKNQWKILRFGVTDYTVLEPNESQNYGFSAEAWDEPFSICIMFTNKKDHDYIDQMIVNLTGYDNDDAIPIEIARESIRKNSILLKFYSQSFSYHLNLTNNGSENESIAYTLLINAREAEIVDSGAEGRIMYLESNSSHTYELFSPEEKTVLIEVIECYGKVELRGTQDYLKTLNDDFDWEFFYPNDNSHILARYDVQKGPVFVRVTSMAVNEAFLNETMYFMRSFMVNKGEKMPQEVFLPGNDGVFNWRISAGNDTMENNSLKVDFFTIECGVNCKKEILPGYSVVLFSYTLHVTKEEKLLKTMAKCDLVPTEDEYYKTLVKYFDEDKHPKNQTFEFSLEDDGTYFINIVGEVWGFSQEINDYQEFKVIYRQQQILVHQANTKSFLNMLKENKNLQKGIIATVLVLVISIACCCYYRRKKKVLEKKVYELNEVKAAEGDVFEEGTADMKAPEGLKVFN